MKEEKIETKRNGGMKTIIALAALTVMMAVAGPASAGRIPADCSDTGLGININGVPAAHDGDIINYVITLSMPPGTDCAVSGATINFYYPNGTEVIFSGITLNMTSGDPSIKHFALSPYAVNHADETGDFIRANASAMGDGHFIEDETVTASTRTSTLVIHPAITAQKTCDPPTQVAPGTITWNVTTNNTGDTPLDTTVADSRHGILFAGLLEPGILNENMNIDSGLTAGVYTNTVTATGTDVLGKQVSATASATCIVTAPPQNGKHKVVGNGRIGQGVFKLFVNSEFLPKGEVEFNDKSNKMLIKSISINSITTDKIVTPMTGEVTGQATVNGGGNYYFVLRVKDRGNPPGDSDDAFEISIPSIGYSGGGKVTSGNIEVIF